MDEDFSFWEDLFKMIANYWIKSNVDFMIKIFYYDSEKQEEVLVDNLYLDQLYNKWILLTEEIVEKVELKNYMIFFTFLICYNSLTMIF